MAQAFDAFMNPEGVAVVGASTKEGSIAWRALANVITAGVPRIYPVNPRAAAIMGYTCFQSLAAIPDPVDLAMIVTPASAVPQALRDCVAKGVTSVMICTSGFREAGEEGTALQREIEQILEESPIAVIGPNCLGVFNVTDRRNLSIAASFSDVAGQAEPGPVAFVTQSGAYAIGLFLVGLESGVGFSRIISMGNKVGVDDADLLWWLADDPDTRVILLYTEELQNGRRFYEAARQVARKKPVVIFKVGKTGLGARAAASHTGAMAGSYRVQQAAFKQSGLIEVSHSRSLMEVGKALSMLPPMRGRRVGIVTNSGGQGSEVADLLGQAGFDVPTLSDELQQRLTQAEAVPAWGSPRNPVDLGVGNVRYPEYYTKSAQMLAGSTEVDAVLLLMVGVGLDWSVEQICAGAPELLASGKPVIIVATSHRNAIEKARPRYQGAGIPVTEEAARAVECLSALYRWGELQ